LPTRIELRNLSGTELELPLLEEAARRTLRAEGAGLETLSLAFVDDERITSLNARLLGRDNPTDVIAFEVDEGEGEVIVSVDTARRQANDEGHSLMTELRFLIAHGVLHVLGHDDSDEASRDRMLRRQDEILQQ